MNKTTMQLSGYFDNNFGDDYIIKTIVRSLSDFNFVIDGKENVSRLILEEKNVSISDEKTEYPVLLVTGSGFMINSKKALKSEIKQFLKRNNPGDFCLGCNIEPLKGLMEHYLIRHKLNKFKLIICRDRKSYNWLCRNVRKAQIECLPDILFSMPQEWLPQRKNENTIGISVMNTGKTEKSINYYKSMAEIADFYIDKTGKKVILFALNSGSENDIWACNYVKSFIKNKEKTEIISHGENGEIFEGYSRCNKVIAARFHSAVLAMRMGIDFYPVVYREKMKNLVKDTRYSVSGCSIESIDTGKIKDFVISEDINFISAEQISVSENEYTEILRKFLKKQSGEKNGKSAVDYK